LFLVVELDIPWDDSQVTSFGESFKAWQYFFLPNALIFQGPNRKTTPKFSNRKSARDNNITKKVLLTFYDKQDRKFSILKYEIRILKYEFRILKYEIPPRTMNVI